MNLKITIILINYQIYINQIYHQHKRYKDK